jgi:hypothetical protein
MDFEHFSCEMPGFCNATQCLHQVSKLTAGCYHSPTAFAHQGTIEVRRTMSPIGTNRRLEAGQSTSLCPGISDINLFRYCEGIIYFDAEISDRAFDLCMPEQKLDGPEIASPPVDQGSLCASQ